MSPLNWINLGLIAAIVTLGMSVSARQDTTVSSIVPSSAPAEAQAVDL